MSITLKDAANTDVDYGQFRVVGDRVEYIGASHNDITKDWLSVSSQSPKRNATSYGNRRSTFKVVRSVSVATPNGGTEIKDARIEISVSLPVGMTQADIDELQARGLSIPNGVFDALVRNGQTQF